MELKDRFMIVCHGDVKLEIEKLCLPQLPANLWQWPPWNRTRCSRPRFQTRPSRRNVRLRSTTTRARRWYRALQDRPDIQHYLKIKFEFGFSLKMDTRPWNEWAIFRELDHEYRELDLQKKLGIRFWTVHCKWIQKLRARLNWFGVFNN